MDVITNISDYYHTVEYERRVSISAVRGPAQTWASGILQEYRPYPPPVGVDTWGGINGGFDVGRGYDSAATRLWRLLLNRRLTGSFLPTFHVALNSYATELVGPDGEIAGVACFDTADSGQYEPVIIPARHVVLAGSCIESARLVLNSAVGESLPAAGRYLAEHIERRAKIEVVLQQVDLAYSQGISLVIPALGSRSEDRYQIHLRGEIRDEKLTIDIGGFAAMDPQTHNVVTCSHARDDYGIPKAHTSVTLSRADEERTDAMGERIIEVARILTGNFQYGRFITEQFPLEDEDCPPRFIDGRKSIQKMNVGRSYHEAGTLRMGTDPAKSVTDSSGRVHGTANLWVADAALFPCVGIANPMLTIGALAYWVAVHVHRSLRA